MAKINREQILFCPKPKQLALLGIKGRKMKILLVEDDEPTAWALEEALNTHHYIVTLATDGQIGLELAQAFTYDLLLLDVLVPKMDGIMLCRQLRSQGYQNPILLLTALDTTTDRIIGLDAGADDYVVKPFDIEELMARIRALLRRGNSTLPPVIVWGKLRFDPSASEFSYGGKLLRLTPKEYSLLELFLMNPRRVFSRSAILERIWSDEESPGEETITTHIKILRQKLKAAGATAKFIETVHGLGYRLQVLPEQEKPVSSVPSPPTPEIGKPLQEQQITSKSERGGERESGSNPSSLVIESVFKLRQKFKSTFIAQVEVLEQAAQALLEGRLTIELQRKALQEAHRLAGSMGIFGFAKGSELARQIEQLLDTEETIELTAALQIAQLLGLLQQELSKPPSMPAPAPVLASNSTSSTPRILVIDDDVVLTDQLKREASAWNMQVEVALSLKAVRNAIASTPPHIILLDLTFPDPTANGLTLLAELKSQTPQIPVIAFTERDSLSDRLEVARLGGSAFLRKPVSTEQVFKTVTQALNQTRAIALGTARSAIAAKILAVDDDPIILATLCRLLKPLGLDVTTLENPQRFWEVLSVEAPDLLILDWEMPIFSGLDLCQVVRNDPQWSNLPILFLTGHTETDTINRAFAAGADDYISKPIVEQELVIRILNRLKRIRD
ncbi:MAG TPA: response regulator [Coleofasciculaceae cyanobacterium]